MIKIIIVLGNEYFINGVLHFSVKNMNLYVIYVDEVFGSYDSARLLLNKNNVLFLKSLSTLKVPAGTYILGDHGITVCNGRYFISAPIETDRALWSVIKVRFAPFISEFSGKIVWNNILYYLKYISFLTMLLWIIVYWNFELTPVNIVERQAMISSLYS